MANEQSHKVLMNARRDGGTLTLRIDVDSLLSEPAVEQPVSDLILFGLREAEDLYPRLAQNIDKVMDYEVYKEGDDKRIRFRLQDNLLWEEYACAGIIEVSSGYTLADWTQKCKRLIRQSAEYEHYANLYGRRYLALKEWLEKEVGSEQERVQRRLLLADPAQTERAALLEGQVKFFDNALETLRTIEAEGSHENR